MKLSAISMKIQSWCKMKPSERIEEIVSKRIREEGLPHNFSDYYVSAIIQLLDEIISMPDNDTWEENLKKQEAKY